MLRCRTRSSPRRRHDPEHEALLADSVGLALLVVLETLTPPERLAFVLHDMFAIPFDEIAPILDRSPDAARQLASRARRRVRGAGPSADADRAAQREVVDAFLAAAREGDFEALLAVLDPDVVLRADTGSGTIDEVRGAVNVARRAMAVAQMDLDVRPALINGAAGWVSLRGGNVFSVGALTLRNRRITTMDILADPARLARLDLTGFDVAGDTSATVGRATGWSVEEDTAGGFHWSAFGPRGSRRGSAETRAEAEAAAQQAERGLTEPYEFG